MPATAATLVLRVTGLYDLKLLKSNAGSVQEVDVSFANSFSAKTNIEKLEFEGDGQKAEVFQTSNVTVEVGADHLDFKSAVSIFAKTAVTASLPSGEAGRVYFGNNASANGIRCGMAAYLTAQDMTTGDNVAVKVVFPVGTLSEIEAPELKTSDKAETKYTFTSEKTTVDIAGVALPGVPSDGCHWYYALLS